MYVLITMQTVWEEEESGNVVASFKGYPMITVRRLCALSAATLSPRSTVASFHLSSTHMTHTHTHLSRDAGGPGGECGAGHQRVVPGFNAGSPEQCAATH